MKKGDPKSCAIITFSKARNACRAYEECDSSKYNSKRPILNLNKFHYFFLLKKIKNFRQDLTNMAQRHRLALVLLYSRIMIIMMRMRKMTSLIQILVLAMMVS